MEDLKKQKVSVLKGVGPYKARLLSRLGINTVLDLLRDFPYRYVDRKKPIKVLFDAPDSTEKVTIEAKVVNKYSFRRNLKLDVIACGAKISIIFMYGSYLLNHFNIDKDYFFYGVINDKVMFNPEFSSVDETSFIGLQPVYSLTKGLSQKEARRLHIEALKLLKSGPLNEEARMIISLHSPASFEEVQWARRRVVLSELVQIRRSILSAVRGKVDIKHEPIRLIAPKNLPYRLTASQIDVLDEIEADLNSGYTMNRIVQGDVGSGKSVLAYIAANAMAAVGQVVIMAPTAILAQQLYNGFKEIFPEQAAALLYSGLQSGEKKRVLAGLAGEDIRVLFSTHAVVYDTVKIPSLMLVITDEQQRFGLISRRSALDKALVEHSLYLTATPIPRTMALSLYGDMDTSVLREKPSDRKPIFTKYIEKENAIKMLEFVQKEIDEGRQAYFVVPSIEKSLLKVEQRLKKRLKARIATVHGQMHRDKISEVMEQFRLGDIDLLVCTTIIEVGMDVKNASIMVIMEADKFGLSQLHQIRGRVGRSGQKSYCFLLSPRGESERMNIIVNSNDGAQIALRDLELRGPGSFLGDKQSGSLELSFDFSSADMELADKIARDKIGFDEALEEEFS